MAEEQSVSDSSLIALTSHFAQVQFRLKQITLSPVEQRESLLHELEDFAYQGCPVKLSYDTVSEGEKGSTEQQHHQLNSILDNLQSKLTELTGPPPDSPSSVKKQSIVLDELRKRFDMQFGDLDTMSENEVREKVGEVMDKTQKAQQKDLIVRRLASQVRSMEEYITQLQSELAVVTQSEPAISHHTQSFSDVGIEYDIQWSQKEDDELLSLHQASSEESLITPLPVLTRGRRKRKMEDVHTMRRTLAVMQILTLWGCGGRFEFLPKPSANRLKKYPSALRSLEIAVDRISVITTALNEPGIKKINSARLESELYEAVSMNLADSLCSLLEQGWEGQLKSMPASCIPPFRWVGIAKLENKSDDSPAWQTVLYYYRLKKGPIVCDKPDLKLSSSFGLPVDGTLSPKQTFLSSVYRTDKCFTNCKNFTPDVKFRSFVCQGFNLHHLSDWIRLLVNHPTLIDDLYQSTAFIFITRFRPVLQILERLNSTQPVCPVSLPSSYYFHTTDDVQ